MSTWGSRANETGNAAGSQEPPASLRVEPGPEGETLVWRWYSRATLRQVGYCLLWDAVLVGVLTTGSAERPALRVVMAAILVLGAAVLHYHTLLGFINRTIIRATREEIAVRHAPLPWPGSRTLATADVERLGYQDMTRAIGAQKSPRHAVIVTLKDGTQLPLVSFPAAEEATFVAKELNRRLPGRHNA